MHLVDAVFLSLAAGALLLVVPALSLRPDRARARLRGRLARTTRERAGR